MKRIDLGHIFASAIARRVAYVVVGLLLAGIGIGRADAQAVTQQDAYQACMVRAQDLAVANLYCTGNYQGASQPGTCYVSSGTSGSNFGRYGYRFTCNNTGYGPRDVPDQHLWSSACPAGTTWNENAKTCHDSAVCLAKPLGSDLTVTATSAAGTYCDGGCQYEAATTSVTMPTSDGKYMTYAPIWQPSGNACATGDAPKPTTKQQCTPIAGQTVCLRNDGQYCASAPTTGKQFCWQPGETGQKTDGPDLQKRDAGTQPIPPNLQLPSGDSLVQSGQPATTTTTVSNNNTVTNVTTTITNYTTQNGTNAGTSNQGSPSDGSTGDGGEGDGDGTATGGTDCDTPPIVSGDQVLGMIATQTWATRCAAEAGNAVNVSGDVGDCSQPFTVQGNDANALKLRAMRADICKGDGNGDGQPDWTEGDGPAGTGAGEDPEGGILGLNISTDILDAEAFFMGSQTCPQLGVVQLGPFGEFDLNSEPWWCNLVLVMRGVVLLLGAFVSLSIMMGGRL